MYLCGENYRSLFAECTPIGGKISILRAKIYMTYFPLCHVNCPSSNALGGKISILRAKIYMTYFPLCHVNFPSSNAQLLQDLAFTYVGLP